MKKSVQTGHIGETYTCYRLALEGVKTQRTPNYFCFDVLTEHGARLEVKTAHLARHKKKFMTNTGESETVMIRWQFRNQLKDGKKRDRNCDFFVFVGLAMDSDTVERVYIAPAHELSSVHGVAIGYNSKKYEKFIENWNVIKEHQK